MLKTVSLIGNPIAGRGRAPKWMERFSRTCERAGVDHQLYLTEAAGDAERLARKEADAGADLVAVFGGDGTLHEVVNALAYSDTALGLVPCGTGNDFARSLDLPRKPAAAVQHLLRGKIRTIDLGYTGERYFVNLAALGFASDVVKHAQHSRLGRAAFFTTVYQHLRHLEVYPLTLRLDDDVRRVHCISLHISNTRYSGGGMNFAPDADPTDGRLNVSYVTTISAWQFARTFPDMYRARGVQHPALHRQLAQRIDVQAEQPLTVMCDGELVGHTPLHVAIAPNALRVLVS